MKKTMKQLLALGMVVTMTGSLAGCGAKANEGSETDATPTPVEDTNNGDDSNSSDAEGESQEEEKTYDFGGVTVKAFGGQWNNLDSEELVHVEAKEYVEKKYNIKLEKAAMEGYDGTNDDDLLITSIAAGDPATDLIALNPENMVSLFLNNVLFDITDFKDELQVGSIYTEVGSWQGRCYGVSYDNIGDAWVLVYDRQLLKDIGMEKTPTEMFMEGNWDFESCKEYLTEMKSKLPEGVYPIGQYPYHYGVMAASASGTPIMDSNGKLNFNNDALVEAMTFYQELEEDGLAYPAAQITKEDGSTGYDYAYAVDDERIVLKRAEAWQLADLPYEYGIAFWPWGSEVTCEGDYTTLSDNYGVAGPYWGFNGVVDASVEKLGIPGEVLTQITYDYVTASSNDGKTWMHEAWVAEQEGNFDNVGAEYGEPRSFYTEEDIELFDWAHSRYVTDYSWAFDAADIVSTWTPFKEIFYDYKDVRSTLESYYNEGAAALEELGLSQK